MRRINSCLNKQLINIYQQAIQLDNLNLKLQQFLPEPLNKHCCVSSFNKGCLVISTTDASWATQLRYCQSTLRDQLRQEAGLYQLMSIKIRLHIEPSSLTALTVKPATRRQLSPETCHIIQKAAESCTYQPLKNALFQLANNKDSTDCAPSPSYERGN